MQQRGVAKKGVYFCFFKEKEAEYASYWGGGEEEKTESVLKLISYCFAERYLSPIMHTNIHIVLAQS